MTTGGATVTDVVGGSHGMAVATEHALDLAAVYADAADRLRGWATDTGRVLVDADLLASAPLSPTTFAEAEAAVLAATCGRDGLVAASVVWEADATTVRVAVLATRTTDGLVAATLDALDHAGGRAVGFTLGATATLLLPPVVGGVLAATVLWSRLPPDQQAELRDEALRQAQDWLARHPEAAQHVAHAGGGLLEGLWDGITPLTPGGPLGFPLVTPDPGTAAAALAAFYADGHAHVRAVAVVVPGATAPPADLVGLVRHLAAVNDLSPPGHSALDGTVEVQTIRTPDGATRHVVYLPGTDDPTTTPWSQDGDVRDLGTNLLLVAGRDNAYQEGILAAMHQAGVRPGEPVALVGHSQGGMEAAAILSRGSPYDVTHVVTVGSPTAQVPDFPPGSHVLSLENLGDVVPLLDGADNTDSPEQVTVRFRDEGGPVGEHELGHYVAGAVAAQAVEDPSVRDLLAGLRSSGFVGAEDGSVVTSQVFQVTRVP